MVMQEPVNVGEDVLVFYNDKASFNAFVDMMRVGTKERRTGWTPLTAAELSSKTKRNVISLKLLT
jgi:hypothetical protein